MNRSLFFNTLCIIFISSSIFGMKEDDLCIDLKHPHLPLFKHLKQQVDLYLKEDTVQFAQCWNNINYKDSTVSVIQPSKNNQSLELHIGAFKKSYFSEVNFKSQLTILYKAICPEFKKSFEEKGFTLGAGIGEGKNSLALHMYIKEPKEEQPLNEHERNLITLISLLIIGKEK